MSCFPRTKNILHDQVLELRSFQSAKPSHMHTADPLTACSKSLLEPQLLGINIGVQIPASNLGALLAAELTSIHQARRRLAVKSKCYCQKPVAYQRQHRGTMTIATYGNMPEPASNADLIAVRIIPHAELRRNCGL